MTSRTTTTLAAIIVSALLAPALVATVQHYRAAPALPSAADLYISELEHMRTVHPDGSHCTARYWTDGVHEVR